MDSLMTPEDRIALVGKINAKLNDLKDDELKDLAKEIGIEEEVVVEDADKSASKAIADAVMMDTPSPVVDTGVLAGPRDGLRNFLLKKTRDRESQS